MKLVIYRDDARGDERWTEVRIPEPMDAAHLIVTVDGEDIDYGEISTIDETWEPRG